MEKTVFVLGATGFIGMAFVKSARAAGLHVKALVRQPEQAQGLRDLGVDCVMGDARQPHVWISHVANSTAILDLVQPALPSRLTVAAARQVGAQRLAMTQAMLDALQTLPAAQRPLWINVSGIDDLAADTNHTVHSASATRTSEHGFSRIGAPVRQLLEGRHVASAFVYLGTVYGPGKAFAQTVFPSLAKGALRLPGKGDNRMALIHVEDAAAGLVDLCRKPVADLQHKSFLLTDGCAVTMREFFGEAAQLMGVAAPSWVPMWAARLAVGRVMVETLTRDVQTVPFVPEAGLCYPTYKQGLPVTLQALGYPRAPTAARGDSMVLLAVVAVAAMLAENLLHFPLSLPWMQQHSAGLPILDMRLHYTVDDVRQLFDALGSAGRTAYLTLLWTVDLILPALFGQALRSAMARGAWAKWRNLALAAAGADYAENVLITALLLSTEVTPSVVGLASAITGLKFALYIGSGLLALTGHLVPARTPRATT